jgi:hypothetical protein
LDTIPREQQRISQKITTTLLGQKPILQPGSRHVMHDKVTNELFLHSYMSSSIFTHPCFLLTVEQVNHVSVSLYALCVLPIAKKRKNQTADDPTE